MCPPGSSFDPHIHRRRSVRLKNYDYSRPGAYFVTVCAYQRAVVFGEIQGESVKLNRTGLLALNWWEKLPDKFENVILDERTIMPDHMHGIIRLVGADPRVRPGRVPDTDRNQGAHTGAPLPRIIQWFKTMSTNEYLRSLKQSGVLDSPPKLWQRNYYEHIIRNETELAEIRQYIKYNAQKLSPSGVSPLIQVSDIWNQRSA